MSRLPFLRTWLRTRNAIILHLSNGTIQVSHSTTENVVSEFLYRSWFSLCRFFRSTSFTTTPRSLFVQSWVLSHTSTKSATTEHSNFHLLKSTAVPRRCSHVSSTPRRLSNASCSRNRPRTATSLPHRMAHIHIQTCCTKNTLKWLSDKTKR